MRLSSKVDDGVDAVFVQDVHNEISVGDVTTDKDVVGASGGFSDRLGVGAVVENVEVDEADVGVSLGEVIDKVGTDETTSTSNKNVLEGNIFVLTGLDDVLFRFFTERHFLF